MISIWNKIKLDILSQHFKKTILIMLKLARNIILTSDNLMYYQLDNFNAVIIFIWNKKVGHIIPKFFKNI